MTTTTAQLDWISKTSTLTFLLLVTIALVACFSAFIPSTGGVILDNMGPVTEAQALLGSMSEAQKLAHFRITLWLDMAFPLAYGGLFAGLTLRNFKTYGKWLALPALLVIPVDIIENIIQLVALSGSEDLLGVKSLLTPTKFMLFNVAGSISLFSIALAVVRGIIARRAH